MHLIFLGTASCYPTKHRGVSCTAVRFGDGDIWLFDCGEGSQLQIQKSKICCGKVKKIFITHLHGDHIFGLPGLICLIGAIDRTEEFTLEIYGPLGLRRYLRESLNLSRSTICIKWTVHELIPLDWQYPKELKDWTVLQEADQLLHPQEILGQQIECCHNVWTLFQDSHGTIKAGTLVHRIPCFGFSIQQDPIPGRLNPNLLLQMGVKAGPLYGKLKRGESITLETGKIKIHPQEVCGPESPGLKVTILGDTSDSGGMSDIAQGSDVVVHEATHEDGMRDKALMHGHSTPSMAATFAKQINAKHLVLFHYSQRYKTTDEEPSIKILYNESVEAFKRINYNCQVSLAQDLMELNVHKHEFLIDS